MISSPDRLINQEKTLQIPSMLLPPLKFRKVLGNDDFNRNSTVKYLNSDYRKHKSSFSSTNIANH